jgi:hypothetical protein
MDPFVQYPSDPDMPVSHLPFSPCVRVGDLVIECVAVVRLPASPPGFLG